MTDKFLSMEREKVEWLTSMVSKGRMVHDTAVEFMGYIFSKAHVNICVMVCLSFLC